MKDKVEKKKKAHVHSNTFLTTFMDIQDITKYEMVSVNRTLVFQKRVFQNKKIANG